MEKEETRKLNKKMLERLIIIHNAIKSGIYPNNEKLRQLYCEKTGYEKVGEATINRDIDFLRVRFNAPLEYDGQNRGYYYTDSNFELSLNNISAQDMFYLASAKTLLSSFKGSPLYEEISDVINFLTDTQVSNQSELLDRIAVAPAPQVKVDENVWKAVLESIKKNKVLTFDYKGRWNTKTTHRTVRPYQILLDDGMYFLFGYAEERKSERLFCLTRMKNISLSNRTFNLPKKFDFISRCGGGKFGSFVSSNVEKYVIDFYGDARQYVKDCVWADDQKITDDDRNDTTEITFSSAQGLKIREWVLTQGGNAKPVKPKWFVDEWKEQVQLMMQNAGLK